MENPDHGKGNEEGNGVRIIKANVQNNPTLLDSSVGRYRYRGGRSGNNNPVREKPRSPPPNNSYSTNGNERRSPFNRTSSAPQNNNNNRRREHFIKTKAVAHFNKDFREENGTGRKSPGYQKNWKWHNAKDDVQNVCYRCEKPGHIQWDCPNRHTKSNDFSSARGRGRGRGRGGRYETWDRDYGQSSWKKKFDTGDYQNLPEEYDPNPYPKSLSRENLEFIDEKALVDEDEDFVVEENTKREERKNTRPSSVEGIHEYNKQPERRWQMMQNTWSAQTQSINSIKENKKPMTRSLLIPPTTSHPMETPESPKKVSGAQTQSETAFIRAFTYDQVNEMEKILRANRNIDINAEYEVLGTKPLHYACENGKLKIVETLLKHPHIDVTLLDSLGRNPLSIAENSPTPGCTAVVLVMRKYLVTKGIEIRRDVNPAVDERENSNFQLCQECEMSKAKLESLEQELKRVKQENKTLQGEKSKLEKVLREKKCLFFKYKPKRQVESLVRFLPDFRHLEEMSNFDLLEFVIGTVFKLQEPRVQVEEMRLRVIIDRRAKKWKSISVDDPQYTFKRFLEERIEHKKSNQIRIELSVKE